MAGSVTGGARKKKMRSKRQSNGSKNSSSSLQSKVKIKKTPESSFRHEYENWPMRLRSYSSKQSQGHGMYLLPSRCSGPNVDVSATFQEDLEAAAKAVRRHQTPCYIRPRPQSGMATPDTSQQGPRHSQTLQSTVQKNLRDGEVVTGPS